MSLPELIEIVPLQEPVYADVTVPGSKSITNRALILAALARGKTVLHGALWSEDTQVMVDCLRHLGFQISVEIDAAEFCNRIITVEGQGGRIPNAGSTDNPLELFVGNAGTAARFLSAFVCLGHGVFRLHGVPRMHERPQGALFKALRDLGYRLESEKQNDKLPAKIFGVGLRRGSCTVSIEESSQFASALLLCAKLGSWQIKITGENADESPYVAMTSNLVEAFPKDGGTFQIEPDSSGGSYFWAVNAVNSGKVSVRDWPKTDWQIDTEFPKFLPLPSVTSRQHDLGDSIMTSIVVAPFAPSSVKFTELGRLRVQECERVVALRTELTKCGAKVVEEGNTLTVCPSPLHGAEIETYHDHRVAMCFAILGLKVPGIKIKNPDCVKKTFPNFFQKLAAQPPHGLGVTILEGKTGKRLSHDELFAD